MITTATLHNEPEISAPIDLCGPGGTLNRDAVAWSRHPLHRCNLPASLARKKKWNYWAVTNDDLRTAVSGRIDLRFEPEFERVSRSGRRESYFTDARQVFGTYSGRIAPDGGGTIELRDMFGWIEDHEARW